MQLRRRRGARQRSERSKRGRESEFTAAEQSRLRLGTRAQLHTMSDAAASKVLHRLVADLFVMWLKQAAMVQGYRSYTAFIVGTHELSKRLLTEADMAAGEARGSSSGATQMRAGWGRCSACLDAVVARPRARFPPALEHPCVGTAFRNQRGRA